ARDRSTPSGYRVFTHGGRTPTDLDALAWVTRAIPLGAGELCVNSIDQDGTRAGYDLELLGLLRKALNVPIIVSGGAGTVAHMDDALRLGADAVLVASIVHSGEQTVDGLKDALTAAGHPMRLDHRGLTA